MKTSTKALIIVGSVVTVGIVGYLIYRSMKKKSSTSGTVPDNAKSTVVTKTPKGEEFITLEITDTDWANRSVSFRVLLNGKPYMAQTVAWENKFLGSEFGYVGSPLYKATNQIEVVGANLTNGLILVVKSNGINKTGKMINFASKKITDYNGANLGQDIAKASEVMKGVMASLPFTSFFDGEGFSSADSTPPPMDFTYTQKWVHQIVDGKDYCRWYDKEGRNTRTYNQPCSRSQANMGQNKKKK